MKNYIKFLPAVASVLIKISHFFLFGFLFASLLLFSRNNSEAAQACQLQSAFWTGDSSSNLSEVAVMKPILLTVRSAGCKDWKISVNVWESDGTDVSNKDDLVANMRFTLNGSSEQTFKIPYFTAAQYAKGKDGSDPNVLTMYANIQAGESQIKSGFFYLKPATGNGDTGTTDTEDIKKVVSVSFDSPRTNDNFIDLLKSVLAWMAWIAIPVAVLVIIFAGVILLTSQGNETRIKQGKAMLTWAVIGLAIVLLSYAITYFVGSTLSGAADVQGSNT